MKYNCGEEVKLNDHVLIEQGQVQANVVRIVEAQEELKEVRVKEPGVFLTAEPFGVVFWPIQEINDPIKFKSRGKTFKPFQVLQDIT